MPKLTVIGCSGSFPGPDSPASSYLVEVPHEDDVYRLLIDIGSGALGNLQNHVALDGVDAIALSHLHPDHCLDLCGYYVVRKYHPHGPMAPLAIYGPRGTQEYIGRAYGLEAGESMDGQFVFHDWSTQALDSSPLSLGPLQVEVMRVEHPVESYAIAISVDGTRLVYTGDTGPFDDLASFALGADILLAEASFMDSPDNPHQLHLSGVDAGRLAAQANVGRLLLTHIPAWHDKNAVLVEAKTEFDRAELVHPDAVYEW